PRLRGVVRDIADLYSGLLFDLAHYRFLETFAWLDEAGDGRVSAFRPRCLAAQQGTFAAGVGHQHDDGGIEPRKRLGVAVWARTPHYVSGAARRIRRAADSAEPVPRAPQHQRPRI